MVRQSQNITIKLIAAGARNRSSLCRREDVCSLRSPLADLAQLAPFESSRVESSPIQFNLSALKRRSARELKSGHRFSLSSFYWPRVATREFPSERLEFIWRFITEQPKKKEKPICSAT